MTTFITISRGETLSTARPLLVASDPDVIAEVWAVVGRLLGVAVLPPKANTASAESTNADP